MSRHSYITLSRKFLPDNTNYDLQENKASLHNGYFIFDSLRSVDNSIVNENFNLSFSQRARVEFG